MKNRLDAKCDNCLAICQMQVLNTVLAAGGMNMEQALRELGLVKARFVLLAKQELLPEIAKAIKEELKKGGK